MALMLVHLKLDDNITGSRSIIIFRIFNLCQHFEISYLLLSINASLFPEYCRIENYIHVVRSITLHLQLKIKTFQKCTIKNKEVEIMEGWCLSGYDGRYQWSLS